MKTSAAGAAVVVGGSAWAETAAAPVATRRVLGRTGLEVTPIGIGTFRTTEPAVIRVALEKGVNFLDTARSYHNGNNEAYVGEAIKGLRDQVYISTKFTLGTKEEMTQSVDTSLSKLGTDHIDVLFLHHMFTKEDVMNAEAREVLVKAREAGKARFLGVSVHKNEVEVINAMLEDPDKLYDVVMVVYNFQSGDEIKDAIARAAKAGIGVVAMKTQAGGYDTKELGDVSPHQAALKWVLRDPNVASTVPSMVNLDQIKEDTALLQMDLTVTRADQHVLDRYAQAVAPYYCHRCGSCEATCPQGVDIPMVNRCLMYAEGYRDLQNAHAAYAELPKAASLASCASCATCVAQCVRGISLPDQMQRARVLFA